MGWSHPDPQGSGPGRKLAGSDLAATVATVKRLPGLLALLVATGAAAGPSPAAVHVPAAGATPGFTTGRLAPAIWLPELDAGSPLEARVFAADDNGVPVAFALDGGPLSLSITYDATSQRDPGQVGDWVPGVDMAVGYEINVGGLARSLVTAAAYRHFVFDGSSKLDDVTRTIHLGATDATSLEPGNLIYTAYAKSLDQYSLTAVDGGVAYNTSIARPQQNFPENVGAFAGVPASTDMLVGVNAGDNLIDAGALFTVARGLKSQPVQLEDGGAGHLGRRIEGMAVYHAHGVGDWALVATDGRLLLYQVKPSFGFLSELTIDSAASSSYFSGIALSNLALGPYDKGVVVVGNAGGGGQLLFVRWDDIVAAVDAGLAIDTTVDPRTAAALGGGGDGGSSSDGGSIAQPPLTPGIGGSSSTGCSSSGESSLVIAGMLLVLGALVRGRR